MLLSHSGKTPSVHPTAFVAITATVCGDVRIGANCRIMYGASIIAEGGSIEIGDNVIALENAVIRSTSRYSTVIGAHCVIGPNAHLVGCIVEPEVFIATGASVFHGARLGARSEVRINAVVHIKTTLPEETTVPIGWVAVGDPMEILPPSEHDRVWELQKPLNFPLTAYGIERSEATMTKITERMAAFLESHSDDQEV